MMTPADSGTPMDSGSAMDAGADAGAPDAGQPDAGQDAGTMLPCAVPVTCTVPAPACIGLADNAGRSTFGLRIAQVSFDKPVAFTMGVFAQAASGAAMPDVMACRLNGSATLNWLLQLDTDGGTLKTGGAKWVSDATLGYAFVDEMVMSGGQSFHVQPAVSPGALDGGALATAPFDLLFPLYLDMAGTSVLLLPLKQLTLTGAVSADHDCIGAYNAQGLSPDTGCLPDATHSAFVNGGAAAGFISLEEADGVLISALNQTLCVLLSQNPAMYGTTVNGHTVCKRDGQNKILFQGDWCAATNAAATLSCADSERVTFGFAASSVLVNN